MTMLGALVMAHRAGVRVFVEDGRLQFESRGTPPAEVMAALKEHRELLLEALSAITAHDPFPGEWLTMARRLASAHDRLDALERARSTTAKSVSTVTPLTVERLLWQARDHVCSTACERVHVVCNACGVPLRPHEQHWPHLHLNCRLELVD
jgi:hypothetical protein